MDTAATSTFKLVKKIKDEKFDVDNLHHYSLSLQVGIRDFQLCVTDTRDNKCLILEDYRIENVKTINTRLKVLHSLFDNHHLLLAGFWNSIKLSLKTHKFSLVPSSHFLKDNVSDYLVINSEIKKNIEEVTYYKHIGSDAVNVFAADKKLVNWIQSLYPKKKIQVIQQGSAFIEGVLRYDDHTHEKTMFCLIDAGILHMVVTMNQKLQYYNQFAVRKSNDYLKYMMLVFKELGLSQKNSKVLVWGNIKHQSQHIELLNKYIRDVSFGSKPSYLNFGYQFDEIMDHQYFDVFSIFLCD
ncbi:MAG: DUF3822 family protein [bacterium]|nr:DUF3822 family protein [bacterium]